MRIELGRGFFAVAAASLAIFSLTYGGFGPSAQLLPSWIPGRETAANWCALVLLAASAGLSFSRTATPAVWTIGAYLAVWAVLGTPPILSKPLSIGAWYGFCEATTALVGAWIVYVKVRRQPPESGTSVAGDRAVRAAQVLFGLTCVFYGASHFVYADYTASMVPTWLPDRLGVAYLTGLAHLAAGVGIVVGILPRLAATLEATMMSLFGLLVWVPSFFAQPPPQWATPPQNQWSELVVNLLLAASACIVAASLRNGPWGLGSRSRA
jgi:uncharacterized membrane protein